jgi:hypothetical protein
MSLTALLSALRLAALSANNNLSDNALAGDLKQHRQCYLLLARRVIVRSHHRRCAFARRASVAWGHPPKSLAAVAALVLRKLCGNRWTHTLRAEPEGWVACRGFSARTDTLRLSYLLRSNDKCWELALMYS